MTDDERRQLAHVAFLVLDITPIAMRMLANSNRNGLTPENIQNNYEKWTKCLNDELRLTKSEKRMFSNPGMGFTNCDTSFLYKIIQKYKLVDKQTQGWAQEVKDL